MNAARSPGVTITTRGRLGRAARGPVWRGRGGPASLNERWVASRLRDLRGRHLTAAYTRIVEHRQAEIAEARAKRAARIAEVGNANARRRAQGKKRMRSTTRGAGKVSRPVGPSTLENIHGTLRAALADALYTDEPLITGEIWKAAKFTNPKDHETVPSDIDHSGCCWASPPGTGSTR